MKFEKQTVASGGEITLEVTAEADSLARGLTMEADDPNAFLVVSVAVAGHPLNVGGQGTPLGFFSGLGWTRATLVRAGETIRVRVHNVGNREHTVWGEILTVLHGGL